jgi:hypothetical protein
MAASNQKEQKTGSYRLLENLLLGNRYRAKGTVINLDVEEAAPLLKNKAIVRFVAPAK